MNAAKPALRVLQVHNPYVQASGEDSVANDDASLLEAAGHTVDRYRVANPEGAAAAAVALASSAWNPKQVRRIRQRIRETRPDVAHVHNTWFALSPAILHAIKAEGVPIVMTIHNYRLLCANGLFFREGSTCTECLDGHVWRAVKHKCYRDSAPQSAFAAANIKVQRARSTWQVVDRFIAPSSFIKEMFVRAGFDEGRIVLRSHPTPDMGVRVDPPSRARSVLYVGRLSREKGVEVLLDAWHQASDRVAGLELVFVGDGPLRNALEDRNVPGVRFVGYRSPDEVRDLLLTARACLVPSQSFETFGRAMVEALSAGLPVTASNIASPGEIIADLGTNWLVEPRDVAAWGQAISQLTDDRIVDAAGQRARELFLAKYRPQSALESLERIYRSLVD